MKILGLHDGAGCGHWRVETPLRELERHGHEVSFHRYTDDKVEEKIRSAASCDVLVAQRMVDYCLLEAWLETGRRTRLVYEVDDDITSVSRENLEAFAVYTRPEVRAALRATAESAHVVTVTTEPLAEVFREFNPTVAVLPNYLPDTAFTPRAAPLGHRPVIGWIGGSSHARDLHVAAPAVRRALAARSAWTLQVHGHDYRDAFAVPGAVHVEWKSITGDEPGYFRALDTISIGIAPVLETQFTRSKSALKAMEYAARGIPVVASDCEAYRGFVIHGVTGFLARTSRQWHEYLSLLMSDEDLRLKMGAAARNRALQYKISDHWQLWEKVYSAA